MLFLARFLFWSALFGAFALAVAPQAIALPYEPNDKIQHIAGFVVLSGFAAWAYPRTRLSTLLLGLALFGGLIELAQSIPAIGRDADFFDWGADVGAAAVTLILVGELRSLIWGAPISTSPEYGNTSRFELVLAALFIVAVAGTAFALSRQIGGAQLPDPALAGPVAAQANTVDPTGASAMSGSPAQRDDQAGAGEGTPSAQATASPTAPARSASNPSTSNAPVARSANANQARASLPAGTRALQMPVTIGGAARGNLHLAIDQSSLIFADTGELAVLLPRHAKALADLGPGYASLIALRKAGIDLRYHREADRIEIGDR
jgi:hypothetical protein